MANVFYVDLGFDKETIGRVTKGFGLVMTIAGGFLGGILAVRFGVMKTLFLGALLAAGTNLLFAFLAALGPDVRMLAAVIAADNLSAGIASAAFVAYLSGLTGRGFTATQYALFSSLMLLLPSCWRATPAWWSRRSATPPFSSAPPRSACRCWCWWSGRHK